MGEAKAGKIEEDVVRRGKKLTVWAESNV